MNDNTILVFTCTGLSDAPAELQQKLAAKFLQLKFDVKQFTELPFVPCEYN
jgi:hypothetical protein